MGKADLTDDAAGVANGENRNGVAFAPSTFGAAGAMADGALKQRAAKDIAGLGEAGKEAVALFFDALLIHY